MMSGSSMHYATIRTIPPEAERVDRAPPCSRPRRGLLASPAPLGPCHLRAVLAVTATLSACGFVTSASLRFGANTP